MILAKSSPERGVDGCRASSIRVGHGAGPQVGQRLQEHGRLLRGAHHSQRRLLGVLRLLGRGQELLQRPDGGLPLRRLRRAGPEGRRARHGRRGPRLLPARGAAGAVRACHQGGAPALLRVDGECLGAAHERRAGRGLKWSEAKAAS